MGLITCQIILCLMNKLEIVNIRTSLTELDVQQKSYMDLSVQLVRVRQDMVQSRIAEHSSPVQVTQTIIQDLVDVPKVPCIMILSNNVIDRRMWRDVKTIMRMKPEIFSNTLMIKYIC